MKVHLIDGTFELYRCHFGAPGSTSPSGREVGATRGFARSLLSLLREDHVTHVACAFDHVIESFRNELFDGYKTGEGIEPELWAQFPLVERAAEAIGIVSWPMIEFEADDAIAAGAQLYASDRRVEQVVMMSPDKDLAQAVRGTKVVSFDRIRKTLFDHEGVVAKFGIEPGSIPDYLALVGDTADGIPGLPRWGAKSSSTVLAEYKHLENIPDDETTWTVKVRGAAGLAKTLREGRGNAELYKKLATLRTDVPIAESVDDLEWRGAHADKMQALADELGDSTLVSRVHRWAD